MTVHNFEIIYHITQVTKVCKLIVVIVHIERTLRYT